MRSLNRVLGCVVALIGVGLAGWAPPAVLVVSFVFAGLIVWAQQVAIWDNSVGWVLVGLFCALAVASGVPLARPGGRAAPTAAGAP